jgi:hypothetical protein
MASKNQTGTLAYIYRVFRMAVLLLLIGVIGLVLRKSPPPVVNTAADAAATLQANLEEEKKSANAKQPHALTLNEAELNSMLVSGLQLASSSSVRDVKIRLLDDRVLAYVVFLFHGKELSLQLEGQLSVDDSHLRFTPSAGKLGSLPLPQIALNNAVARLFDSPENKEKLRVPPEVADVRVSGGELVVSYR